MFMCPINSPLLLKLLRHIMQVSNPSHDVNSDIIMNFVICFLAVRTYQLQHLRFWVCSWTDFHVLNNLLLVDEVGMAEWARIVRSFRCTVRAVQVWLTIHSIFFFLVITPFNTGKKIMSCIYASVELFSFTRLTRSKKGSTLLILLVLKQR